MMHPLVRQTGRDSQSQRAMNQADRIQISPAPEEFTKDNSTQQRQSRQNRAWQMSQSVNRCRSKHRPARSQQRFEVDEKYRLQNELLHQGPHRISSGLEQRHMMTWPGEPQRNSNHRDHSTK